MTAPADKRSLPMPTRPDLPTLSRRAALLGGAALVAGCAQLAAVEAPTLFTLTPKNEFEDGLPEARLQIVVDEPLATAATNTDRIAVRTHPLMVEYYPGVRWIDRAPLMIQTLIAESFVNSRRARSVGSRATGLSGDVTLLSELREFQAELPADAPPGAAPLVRVRIDATLVEEPRGAIFGADSFEAEVRAEGGEMLQVAEAFDRALGKVLRRIVGWAVRDVAAFEASRA